LISTDAESAFVGTKETLASGVAKFSGVDHAISTLGRRRACVGTLVSIGIQNGGEGFVEGMENGKLNICHGCKSVAVRVGTHWISKDTFRREPFFARQIIKYGEDRTLGVDHVCDAISVQITGWIQAGGLRGDGAEEQADNEDNKKEYRPSLQSEFEGMGFVRWPRQVAMG